MIRTLIQDFIEEKRLKQEIHHIILDSKAKIVHQGISKTNTPAFNIVGDFAMTNMTCLHMIRNMGLRGDTGHIIEHTLMRSGSWDDVYAAFGEWDLNYLLYRNMRDEYIFDAYTLVSPNGIITSMIRTPDFNEEKFRKVYDEYVMKLINYNYDPREYGDLEDYSCTFSDYLRFKEAGVLLLQDRGELILWEE